MTIDNVAAAIDSLADYPGVVGIFGGNPCLHPEFPAIARLMETKIQPRRRRGLWSNRLFEHAELVLQTFGYLNLNVHQSIDAAAEITLATARTKNAQPITIYGRYHPSRHGAVLVSPCDLGLDPLQRAAMRERCDINRRWSAAVVQNAAGQPRVYFCEVAAALDAIQGQDNGLPLTDGWWKLPIGAFERQIAILCEHCGVPLRIPGRFDYEHTDDVSERYSGLPRILAGRRHHALVTHPPSNPTADATRYLPTAETGAGATTP